MKKLLLIIIGVVALATSALAVGYGPEPYTEPSFGDMPAWYQITVVYGLIMAIAGLIMTFKVISLCNRFAEYKTKHEEDMKRITEILEEIKSHRS